jgi:hypothetical protein
VACQRRPTLGTGSGFAESGGDLVIAAARISGPYLVGQYVNAGVVDELMLSVAPRGHRRGASTLSSPVSRPRRATTSGR